MLSIIDKLSFMILNRYIFKPVHCKLCASYVYDTCTSCIEVPTENRIITSKNTSNILIPLTLYWIIKPVPNSKMQYNGQLLKKFTTTFVIVVSHLSDKIFTFQKYYPTGI